MTKAVLFDFDGTLMDTEPAILASYRHVFEVYGDVKDFDTKKQVEVLGPSLKEMMVKYFPDKDPDRLVEEYRTYQHEKAADFVHPMEGAVSLLEWIREKGWKTAVISTRYHASIDFYLEKSGMKPLIDAVIGQEDVRNGKPDPEGIFQAEKLFNADEAVYIGDSVTDIEAGKNAGIRSIAFVSNPHKKKSLESCGADAVIYHLDELRDLL